MSEEKKLGLTLAIFFFVMVVMLVLLYFELAYVGWGPLQKEDSLTAKIAKKKEELQKANEKIKKIPELEKKLEQLAPEVRLAEQLIPSEATQDELLAYINDKANEAEIKISKITPNIPKIKIQTKDKKKKDTKKPPSKKKEGTKQLEPWIFTISGSGTYDQMATFINKLEEFETRGPDGTIQKRLFAIEDISIRAAKEGMEEGGIHTWSLELCTYRYAGEDE